METFRLHIRKVFKRLKLQQQKLSPLHFTIVFIFTRHCLQCTKFLCMNNMNKKFSNIKFPALEQVDRYDGDPSAQLPARRRPQVQLASVKLISYSS